jgi:uncharacterized phage-associated protein
MEALRTLGKIHAQLLADFILVKYGPMSHLKLQKLLYYCEAYHLAYFDTNLIHEEFQAWVHGPVCREVYDSLKGSSLLYSDLGFQGDYDPIHELNLYLSTDQVNLIDDVLNELSSWTGLQLENATHKEFPWVEARKNLSPGDKCENKISKDSMRTYYKADLNVEKV